MVATQPSSSFGPLGAALGGTLGGIQASRLRSRSRRQRRRFRRRLGLARQQADLFAQEAVQRGSLLGEQQEFLRQRFAEAGELFGLEVRAQQASRGLFGTGAGAAQQEALQTAAAGAQERGGLLPSLLQASFAPEQLRQQRVLQFLNQGAGGLGSGKFAAGGLEGEFATPLSLIGSQGATRSFGINLGQQLGGGQEQRPGINQEFARESFLQEVRQRLAQGQDVQPLLQEAFGEQSRALAAQESPEAANAQQRRQIQALLSSGGVLGRAALRGEGQFAELARRGRQSGGLLGQRFRFGAV